MAQYKLCRNEVVKVIKAVPITIKGIQYQDTLVSFEKDCEDEASYSIYRNLGDEQDEDWDEYIYFGDNFDKAVETYNQLKGEK